MKSAVRDEWVNNTNFKMQGIHCRNKKTVWTEQNISNSVINAQQEKFFFK